MIPRATLRLQFHRGFTFGDAEWLAPYMASLGVSHLYASPVTTARPGSMHGYDVIDPTEVNPELGGEDGLRRLAAALKTAGLGLIVDIVPNHMAADLSNRWWVDVLRGGESSRYAAYFDIDWRSGGGKVLLPVLGKPLGEALDAGDLAVADGPDGKPAMRYGEQLFPLAEGTAGGSVGEVLARQHYRLAWWRLAGDEINWRRFFDINELVSLRQEDDATFDATHALILRLYGDGVIDGVRVDHVDGLRDPGDYCRRLRAALDAAAPGRRPYLVVEKILLRDEELPASWGCDGTTGYDFMDEVNAVQHDPRGELPLERWWATISGRPAHFAPEEEKARHEILARSFSGPLDACVEAIHPSMQEMLGGDLGRQTLRRVLAELLAHFPVYRTYGTGDALSSGERDYIEQAIAAARRSCLAPDRWAVDLLHRWLTGSADLAIHRLQQMSSPIAAKSVEDTAFYRYGRLLSRNDVGFNIERFAVEAPAFHRRMEHRGAHFPHAMLATATHDHKRGEDLRARLAVISEHAEDWAKLATGWIERSDALRAAQAPSKGDAAMLLQMIVGAWPLDLARQDRQGRIALAERLTGWQEKALREAKLRSDWAAIDEPYEAAARRFLVAILDEARMPELLEEIADFVDAIAPAGAVNGLAQLLLKLTVPGMPDIYQGADYWDFSLVDPDNRRPVDYVARAASLDGEPVALLAGLWRDGRIKQAIMARTLALRRRDPELFDSGSYEPLSADGPMAAHVVAFTRRLGDRMLITVVPRLPTPLMGQEGGISLDPGKWQGTVLRLDGRHELIDAFDGQAIEVPADGLPLASLCAEIPVRLLCSAGIIDAAATRRDATS